MVSNIYVGSVENPLFHFSNDSNDNTLVECKAEISTDLISSELPINTLVFTVNESFLSEGSVISPKIVPGGTTVCYYYGDAMIGTFYVNRLVKSGKCQWTFECEDYIGLLDNTPFYGMYCKADDALTFETAVKHILLTDGIRVFRPCESVSVSGISCSNLYVTYQNDAVTEAHFRYDGLKPGLNESSALSYRLYFYGTFQSTNEDYQKGAYRFIYADITRDSISDKFSDTVTLRFCLGQDSMFIPSGGLELIKVSPGTDVRIRIAPGDSTHEGLLTVNDRLYILPALTFNANGVIPLLGVMESRDYDDGMWVDTNVILTWYSHNINGEEITFAENTAKGCITSLRRKTNGAYLEYPAYDDLSVDKKYFDSIVYRGEKFDDVNCPFSFPNTVDTNIANTLSFEEQTDKAIVVGVIPETTKRDALHQLMFACGICMKQNTDGNFTFSYLLGTATNIPDTSIFDTGDISYDNSVNRLNITTYEVSSSNYDPSKFETVFTNVGSDVVPSGANITSLGDTPWDIYENDSEESGTYFSNGLTVFYTGVITLQGLPCSVLEHKYTWDIANPYGKRSLDVSGCKLITPSNVDVVGEKLTAYYENFTKVTNDIIYSGERCGDKFDFTSPFGETVNAYLSHMSMTAYGFIRANCEFIAGFTPPASVGGYHNVKLLIGSGNFTLPENIKFPLKIVLIGGGQGGSSGASGENGTVLDKQDGSGNGGNGGNGGSGGNGGKVYSITLRESSLKTFPYKCGVGGKGGVAGTDNTPGESGGDTTFGVYSSNQGNILSNGYEDTVTYTTYAVPGENGINGGKGGSVERYPIMTGRYAFYYSSAEDTLNAAGGNTSDELIVSSRIVSSGAGGGGAAYNSDGGDATSPARNGTKVTNASGGAGANADTPHAVIAQTYGSGGLGGHGGGGGGASGTGNTSGYTFTAGKAGQGGKGSNGGNGIDGCVLIFYNTKEDKP